MHSLHGDTKKVAGAAEKSKYVQVTQDGVARLIFTSTSADIEGLYTERLQTCFAIIIAGKNGVALIHNTGQLSYDSIRDEFTRVGEIVFWTMAYNPTFYPQGALGIRFQEAISYFVLAMDQQDPTILTKLLRNPPNANEKIGIIKAYEAKNGYVSISREGKISTTEKPAQLLPPHQIKLREAVNETNNYFLLPEEKVNADVQYDGTTFTVVPCLQKTQAEILALKTHLKFADNVLLTRMIKQYGETARILTAQNIAAAVAPPAAPVPAKAVDQITADTKAALDLLKTGKHEEALSIFLAVAKKREDAKKEDAPLAVCYHNIATCYRRAKDEAKATKYAEKSADLKKKLPAKSDDKVAAKALSKLNMNAAAATYDATVANANTNKGQNSSLPSPQF